jgi:hypothetical protein
MTKFLIILLFPVFVVAQVNKQFVNHLVFNDLIVEHEAYLTQLEHECGSFDSLNYYRAKLAIIKKEDSAFLDYSLASNGLVFKDTNLVNYISSEFLKKSRSQTKKWLEFVPSKYWSVNTININKSILLVENTELDASFLQPHLKFHYDDFVRYNKRKPWVAGLLSAIVPGLGKLYNGRPRSFRGSLLANAFFGAQMYEAIRKKGIKNPYSIISTGIFSVFYLSNIYGSYYDLKRVKVEKKKNFLDEVANYNKTDAPLYE